MGNILYIVKFGSLPGNQEHAGKARAVAHHLDIRGIHQGDPVDLEGIGINVGLKGSHGQGPEPGIVFHQRFGGTPSFHPSSVDLDGSCIRCKNPEGYGIVGVDLRRNHPVSHPGNFLGSQGRNPGKNAQDHY